MSNGKEEFLKLEEKASQLVETLQKLESRITSYDILVNELHEIKMSLVNFIDTTKVLAENTLEGVKVLNTIGGPEILQELQETKNDLMKLGNDVNKNNEIIFNKINEVDEKNKSYINKFTEEIISKLENRIEVVLGLLKDNDSLILSKIENLLNIYQNNTLIIEETINKKSTLLQKTQEMVLEKQKKQTIILYGFLFLVLILNLFVITKVVI